MTTAASTSAHSRRFRDLPILVKLVLGFGAVSLVMMATNVQNLRTMSDLNGSTNRVYTDSTKHLEAVARIQSSFSLSWIGLLMNISGFTAEEKSSGKALYETSMADARSGLESLSGAGHIDDEMRAGLTTIDEKLASFDATVTGEIMPASITGRTKEAYELLTTVGTPIAAAVDAMLKQMFEDEITEGGQISTAANDEYSSQRIQTVVFLIVGVGLAMAIGVWLARQISRPVRRTAEDLGRVANGDLTVEPSFDQDDEVGAHGEIAVDSARTHAPLDE